VPTGLVSGHPSSTLYRLLMGDVESKRDRLAAGRVLTSLFVMEIAPGGTNFPHHHEREEEIYLVLSGHGVMVAGGGIDGIEGRHPAKAGDAYFFRLNCTVGYYSAPDVKSRILAVRSWYPGMQQKGAKH
jgi:Cupin domain